MPRKLTITARTMFSPPHKAQMVSEGESQGRHLGMGAMQLCHHHDRPVAKNRNLGFRGHVRSTEFVEDWERSCFALIGSSFDKYSLLSLILNTGNIPPRCAVLI